MTYMVVNVINGTEKYNQIKHCILLLTFYIFFCGIGHESIVEEK